MTDEKDSAQGPLDPRGPGGMDAPAPPGGPQRTDTPASAATPGEPAQDPGPAVERVTKDDRGEAPPPSEPDPGQDTGQRELQEENAGTSLGQPSQ